MIVIVKNNFGMGYGFRNQHELCWVLEKGKVNYENADFANVQKMEHIEHSANTHPHQKGLQLLGKMINHTTKENDIVFDPFGGSGSTFEAAKRTKRNFIGIELEQKYCEMARDRLRQEILF